MTKNPRTLFGVIALVVAAATPVFAQQPAAGRVKLASGSASIVRASGTVPAKVGDVVYESDVLRTGADGKVGITLKDDTRVSLGPSSEVRLDKFVYSPAQGNLALARRRRVRVGANREAVA